MFETQVTPELVDVKIPPFEAAATSFKPFADAAAADQYWLGAPLVIQVAPKLVET